MGRVRRVVLDVDTGIDDALAILYAVASPALELCGVTTVVGNVAAEAAARNSAAVLACAGAGDVPVAVGATRTLAGHGPRAGPTNHGPDGLGGVRLPAGADPSYDDPGAVLRAAAARGPVTLVGLAPLTNVAGLAHTATDLVLVGGELAAEEPPEPNAGHDPAATARSWPATGRRPSTSPTSSSGCRSRPTTWRACGRRAGPLPAWLVDCSPSAERTWSATPGRSSCSPTPTSSGSSRNGWGSPTATSPRRAAAG